MWFSRNIIAFASLVLLLYLKASKAQQCIPRVYQLANDRETINIASPNYPTQYQPGSSCRHRVTAPRDHVVILTCLFEVSPNTCDSENFLISLNGDLQFQTRESHCRSIQLTRISNYRSIALGYISSRPNTPLRGRFRCQARARRVPCSCGWSHSGRIANGQEARRNEYPSIVALKDLTSPQRVFCSGNIISNRHILTAAHCMQSRRDPNAIVAYAGDHDLSQANETPFEVQYRIQRILMHPDYRATSNGIINDIAILFTQTLMEWSKGVGPICLPWRQQSETFANSIVDVAGWGTVAFAGAKSNTLQKIQVMVQTNRLCQEPYNNTIVGTQICTYDYRGLGRDSCQYDSGGPVILRQPRFMLLGVISYGRSCGQRFGTGVNTRITSHLGWIWRYAQNDVCVV